MPKRSRQERAYSVGSSESEYINASVKKFCFISKFKNLNDIRFQVRSVSVNSVERRASALGISKHESQVHVSQHFLNNVREREKERERETESAV